MGEIERLRDQLERAYRGPAWHGPSIMELLDDVGPAQAAAHPMEDGHSIWELVLHIVAWKQFAKRTIGEGAPLPDLGTLAHDDDWPPVESTDEKAWSTALAKLAREHRGLSDLIGRMIDEDLEIGVPGRDYSNYGLLHGVIQHDLYHGGQIALLKKALT